MNIVLVAIGGAIGAILRYLTVISVPFPFGTLLVNVVGSFLMGLLFVALADQRWMLVTMTGILGGFTTFSAFSLDVVRLFEGGQVVGAVSYAAGTVLISIIAILAAIALARTVWA
ncbi:MAG: CrcB family protein [Pseudomonadota bacterium]